MLYDLIDGFFWRGQGRSRILIRGPALRFTPARQPVYHLGLVTLSRWLVEIRAQQRAGQVLLGQEMIGCLVRIFIAAPVSQGGCVAIAILQVLRNPGFAFLFDQLGMTL
jgi:hypothetical protein